MRVPARACSCHSRWACGGDEPLASTSVVPEGALPVALCPGRPCPAGGPVCGSGPGEEAEAGWLEVAWACSYGAGRLTWAAWSRLSHRLGSLVAAFGFEGDLPPFRQMRHPREGGDWHVGFGRAEVGDSPPQALCSGDLCLMPPAPAWSALASGAVDQAGPPPSSPRLLWGVDM